MLREKIITASDRTKRANSSGLQKGELMRLYNPQRKKSRSPKLTPNWEGPGDQELNDVIYRIQHSPKSNMKGVHLDRLAAFKVVDGARRPLSMMSKVYSRAPTNSNKLNVSMSIALSGNFKNNSLWFCQVLQQNLEATCHNKEF